MMTMSTRFAFAMAALLFSAAAHAELEVIQTGIALDAASEPEITAGRVYNSLKNGKPYQATIVAASEKSLSFEGSDGCNWTRPRMYRAPSSSWENCNGRSGTASVRHQGGNAWPMQVGTKWSWEQSGDNWATDRDCEVEGTARIKVNGHEFDTFKVVCVDRWRTRTSYYAPSAGRTVHSENFHRTRLERTIYEYVPD